MNTDKLYNLIYTWLITKGPGILLAIFLFIAGQIIIKVIRKWSRRFFAGERFVTIRPYLHGLINAVLQVLLILVVMQVLGIQMTVFAALVAAFGVAAGLALSGTLQNFAGGVLILILKPYRNGENIITQGYEGTVSSIQLFYTIITTFDNKTVIVPNSKLSNEIIINTSRQGNRRLDIELKFNYGIEFALIKQIIEKTLQSAEHILASPASRIGVSQIDPDGYKVSVNAWSEAHGFQDTRLLLQEKLVDDLKSAGIKLPGMA